VPGVGSVDVVMTFEPSWTLARVARATRAALGFVVD
jgi:metal-sulfur cluster biosynthetic enzyme